MYDVTIWNKFVRLMCSRYMWLVNFGDRRTLRKVMAQLTQVRVLWQLWRKVWHQSRVLTTSEYVWTICMSGLEKFTDRSSLSLFCPIPRSSKLLLRWFEAVPADSSLSLYGLLDKCLSSIDWTFNDLLFTLLDKNFQI